MEDLRHCLSRLRSDDDGSYSIGTLFVLLIFLLMVHMVVNVAHTAFTKLELQNTADAVSDAAATEMARGMNSITAANHLMGEAQAIVVLHHALGGYELEERDDPHDPNGSRRRQSEQRDAIKSLRSGWIAVQRSRAVPPPFMGSQLANVGLDDSRVGATIYDVRMELRRQLEAAYLLHAVGGWMEKSPIPWIRALGFALATIAWLEEVYLFPQLEYLKYVEIVARTSSPFKRLTELSTIPALQLYCRETNRAVTEAAMRISVSIGMDTYSETALYPPADTNALFPLKLPVVAEAHSTPIQRSQIVRASFPWVSVWKEEIRNSLAWKLPATSVRDYYLKHSMEFTLKKGIDTREELGALLGVYVLLDLQSAGADKGSEPWNFASGSSRADELFGVLGFARRPAVIYSPKYFRNPHGDGQVAIAQSLIYNANPRRASTSTTFQPHVGFDTLNWIGDVPEYPTEALQTPQIQLNWQAKLVPVTRTREFALRNLNDWTGKVTRRLPIRSSLTNTH